MEYQHYPKCNRVKHEHMYVDQDGVIYTKKELKEIPYKIVGNQVESMAGGQYTHKHIIITSYERQQKLF